MAMSDSKTYCSSAVANIDQMIDAQRQLPQNVFTGRWASFHIFDSDCMFESTFVDTIKDLLRAQGGKCACIRNANAAQDTSADNRFFCVVDATSAVDYQRVLSGANAGDGWIYEMGRFACASDAGQWCIYCERSNEIAVIAMRARPENIAYQRVLSRLGAKCVEDALLGETIYGLSPRALSPEWRRLLQSEYAAGSQP